MVRYAGFMRDYSLHESSCVSGKGVPAWRRWLQSYPVATFFVLTFIFSWSLWGAARTLFSGASSGLRIAVHTLGLCGLYRLELGARRHSGHPVRSLTIEMEKVLNRKIPIFPFTDESNALSWDNSYLLQRFTISPIE